MVWFFFILQMVLGIFTGIPLVVRLWTTTQGASISWLVLWQVFNLLNFSLALRSRKSVAERLLITTYIYWIVAIGAAILVMFFRYVGVWDRFDWYTICISLVGICIVAYWGKVNELTIRDAILRGWLALCFRFAPQVIMAAKIVQFGGAGLHPLLIWMGYPIILGRIVQLWLAVRANGGKWARPQIGLVISEVGNVVSWVLVTVAWLMW